MMNSIDKKNNIALEASAGTGKTYQLSMRVTGMLLDDVPPKDILCLTFTRKATAEMLDRIMKLLDELVLGNAKSVDIATLEPLLKQQAAKRGAEYNENYIRSAAKKARDRLLAEFSTLNVKTLDAFFNQILKVFPFEAQLRPDYSIEEESAVNEVKLEAYHSTISELLKKQEWKDVLRKAAEIFDSPLKNFINSKLFAYAQFTDDNYILLEKVIKTLSPSPSNISDELILAERAVADAINILQKFCTNIQAREALDKRQQKVIDKLAECENILDAATGKFIMDGAENHGFFKKFSFTSADLSQIEEFRNYTRTFLKHKSEAIKLITLAIGGKLHIKLAEMKRAKNILTYSDIIEVAYRMLASETSPIDKDYLYFRLDGKINHILIDEFQDTSYVQWLVLKPLVEEVIAGIGQDDKKGSFFYVGDLKQNLYRFRGGSTVLFDKILSDYAGKITKKTLGVNYRSDFNIVEAVNMISTSAAEYFNIDALNVFNIDQTVTDDRAKGYVDITYMNEDETIGEYTVRNVKKAAEAGYRYGEMAVLVPTNDKGKEVADALANESIPVLRETSQKLSSSPAFKAVAALAEFIETGSESAFYNYALIDTFDIAPDKFAEPSIRAQAMQNILSTAQMNAGKTIFEKLIAVIKKHSMYERFKHEPDFIQTLDIMASNVPDEKNIILFKDAIEKAAAAASSVSAKIKNAVTVMTVHKSKGLQFPLVIVPSLSFDLETKANKTTFVITENEDSTAGIEFVHSKDLFCYLDTAQKEAISKENALVKQDSMNRMYVAFTRAKHALIAAVAKQTNTISNIGQLLPQLVEIPYERGTLTPPEQEQDNQDKNEVKYIDTSHFIPQDKGAFEKQPPESFLASITGTALHHAAFLLKEANTESAENALNSALAAYGAYLGANERKTLSEQITQLVNNEDFIHLFKGQVFRERKLTDGAGLYSIDIYSVFPDKIMLADYKTGFIDEQRLNSYTQQMNKYESILSNIYKLPVSKLLFHFSDKGLEVFKL